MALATIENLLSGLVDYAGLFPPAKLDMPAAVAEFDRCFRGDDRWALGRFVVPAARLDEFETASAEVLPRVPSSRPWELSVLPGDDLDAARRRIDAFHRAHTSGDGGRAVVGSVELRPDDASGIARAVRIFDGIEVFCELPNDRDPAPMMAAVAEHGGRAKIRTGGVTEDAFPTPAEVARFLVTAAVATAPFKATAGLHHPLRGEYRLTYEPGSPEGTMHGYLNLFLAAAWVKTAGMEADEAAELLEERSPEAFEVTDAELRWRDRRLSREALAEARRTFALSYGSCSFTEPVDELRELGLL